MGIFTSTLSSDMIVRSNRKTPNRVMRWHQNFTSLQPSKKENPWLDLKRKPQLCIESDNNLQLAVVDYRNTHQGSLVQII